MRRVSLAMVPALLVCTACGPDPQPPPPYELTTAEVAAWAPNVSALAAYLAIYQPLASYDGQAVFSDATCPTLARDDASLSITGGCTDSSGEIWTGSVTMDLATSVLTFTAFGHGSSAPVSTQSGQASIADASATSRDFSIELSGSDGSSIDYRGHVDGAYGARTVWNGSGTFVRQAGGTNGQADAVTTDEVYDDSECGSQPAAGTTELTVHDHAAVVTYNGAIDCGGEGADVTIDGEPKGKIQGAGCSTAPKGGTGGAWFTLILAVAGAWFMRRNRERERL
jgi:MYXO-CTERM domain-containing protein